MATDGTHVDRLYEDFDAVMEYLRTEQPSFHLAVEESLRKGLLLAAASYFERRVTEILVEFVSESAGRNEQLVEFVRRQALNRRYHTLFNWGSANVNGFWGLFGQSFRSSMTERVRRDPKLQDGIRAFLELGNDRNRLVHEDFGSFSLEKTSREIYVSYTDALGFVEALPGLLRDGP